MSGLLLKLDRKVAAEFSFFLAIPIMIGATVYSIYKHQEALTTENIGVVAVGFIASFISGFIAVKFLVKFISNHSFIPFAIYRILFGSVLLTIYAL